MTRQISHFRAAAAALALVLPLAGVAQQARTAAWVNLRAGPDGDYPLVQRMPPGTPLVVQGCVDGYRWCDVVGPGNERGWIYAANLRYPYQNADVPLPGYGAAIGIPIVSFAIASYWNDYYRERPWYGNQRYWHDNRRHSPYYRAPGPGPRPPHYRPPAPRPPVVIVRPPNRAHQPPGARPPNARPHQGQSQGQGHRQPQPPGQPSQPSTDRSNAP